MRGRVGSLWLLVVNAGCARFTNHGTRINAEKPAFPFRARSCDPSLNDCGRLAQAR